MNVRIQYNIIVTCTHIILYRYINLQSLDVECYMEFFIHCYLLVLQFSRSKLFLRST